MSRLKFLERAANYPKETRRINLAKYHSDLEGDYIEVWVNWSRAMVEESLRLVKEYNKARDITDEETRTKRVDALNEEMFAFQSDWWGVPVEDVSAIYQIDSSLYDWIVEEANRLRVEYREERKKVSEDSSDS